MTGFGQPERAEADHRHIAGKARLRVAGLPRLIAETDGLAEVGALECGLALESQGVLVRARSLGKRYHGIVARGILREIGIDEALHGAVLEGQLREKLAEAFQRPRGILSVLARYV